MKKIEKNEADALQVIKAKLGLFGAKYDKYNLTHTTDKCDCGETKCLVYADGANDIFIDVLICENCVDEWID